jgi:opacity protein-like surface antigen
MPLLLCGTALAQHSGPYVGAFVGGNSLATAKSTDDQGAFNLEFKPALQGSAVVGWDMEHNNTLGEGRVELEYSRRSNKIDQVGLLEGKFKGSGSLTMDSLLINGFAVFSDKTFWAPYFGIGIGVARIVADNLQVTGQPLSNDTALVFAYQVGAGLDLILTDYLSLDLGYRFLSSTKPKFKEINGRSFETEYFNHSAVFGFRVGF